MAGSLEQGDVIAESPVEARPVISPRFTSPTPRRKTLHLQILIQKLIAMNFCITLPTFPILHSAATRKGRSRLSSECKIGCQYSVLISYCRFHLLQNHRNCFLDSEMGLKYGPKIYTCLIPIQHQY